MTQGGRGPSEAHNLVQAGLTPAPTSLWHNCYNLCWQGKITAESFSHPAKFSRALIRRIYDHAFAEGWLVPGMTVVDPFGGVGLGALDAMWNSYKWIGIELESDFHILAQRNINLWARKYFCICHEDPNYLRELQGSLYARIGRGQSKTPTKDGAVLREGVQEQLSLQGEEVIPETYSSIDGSYTVEQGQGVVRENEGEIGGISKQWQSSDGKKRPLERGTIYQTRRLRSDQSERKRETGACSSDGTALRSENNTGGDRTSQKRQKNRQQNRKSSIDDDQRAYAASPSTRNKTPNLCPTCNKLQVPIARIFQGDSRRLAELIGEADVCIGSPPFYKSLNDGSTGSVFVSPKRRDGSALGLGSNYGKGYGSSPNQLASLPKGRFFEAVISSPPWGNNAEGHIGLHKLKNPESFAERMIERDKLNPKIHGRSKEALLAAYERDKKKSYGKSESNLGNQSGPTFWSASRKILEQCHVVLKPGGHAIWVCKDFVRAKKRVPFSDQWLKLCESVGFRLVCRHRAMLVTVYEEETLFGVRFWKKERKSFFRRLAEKKGSPSIDYEDVLCLERT